MATKNTMKLEKFDAMTLRNQNVHFVPLVQRQYSKNDNILVL